MSEALTPLRIALDGELSIYRANEVRQQLLDGLSDASAIPIEVDLSRVSEVDSTGVQLLMAARRSASAAGRSLVLVGHSAAVLDAFALMDLAAWFGDPIVESSRR